MSPFGLGEFSGKDYEAVLSGSLLVKPYADKLIAYPNIYDRMLALNVGINFAGLEEVCTCRSRAGPLALLLWVGIAFALPFAVLDEFDRHPHSISFPISGDLKCCTFICRLSSHT